MKTVVNVYYLELIFILEGCFIDFLAVEIDEKGHTDKDIIFEKKDKKHQKKNLVANLLELIQVIQKMVMIQTMRLITWKHLLKSLKIKKIKELEKKLIKEKEMREMKDKSKMREKLEKELKDKNKELKI